MNQNGDIILETHTITDHSPISITEKPAHTASLRKIFKLKPKENTKVLADGIVLIKVDAEFSSNMCTLTGRQKKLKDLLKILKKRRSALNGKEYYKSKNFRAGV